MAGSVCEFRPRAAVDFEGEARSTIAQISNAFLRTVEVLEMTELDADTRQKVLGALTALTQRFMLVEKALDEMEDRAPVLIRKLQPGEYRTFDTANDENTMSVSMTAGPRGAVVYVAEVHFDSVTMRMRTRRQRSAQS